MQRFENPSVSRVRENRTHGLKGGPVFLALRQKKDRVYQ